MELGGLWWTNVLNSALPPQRHRPDNLVGAPRPCQPHGSEEKGEKKKERKKLKNKINKINKLLKSKIIIKKKKIKK